MTVKEFFERLEQHCKVQRLHGYLHNENDGKKGAAKLTTEEKKMVERVEKLWYDYLSGR